MSDELLYESELEVVFSLMSDGELMNIANKLRTMVREKAYQTPRFPLSSAEILWVEAIAMFMYWMRRERGVRVVEGKIVVCGLEESPFVQKYKDAPKKIIEEDGGEEGGGEWV